MCEIVNGATSPQRSLGDCYPAPRASLEAAKSTLEASRLPLALVPLETSQHTLILDQAEGPDGQTGERIGCTEALTSISLPMKSTVCRFTADVDDAFVACSTTTENMHDSAASEDGPFNSDHIVGSNAVYACGVIGRGSDI